MFLSDRDNHPLELNYTISDVIVPPQAKNEEDGYKIMTLSNISKNAMLVSLIIPLGLMLLLSIGIGYTWSLYFMV